VRNEEQGEWRSENKKGEAATEIQGSDLEKLENLTVGTLGKSKF